MIFQDVIRLALRNLKQARLRTGLTILGVAIGIASLSGMLSLGVGLQEQFSGQLLRSGMFDVINVFPSRTQQPLRRRGIKGRPANTAPAGSIAEESKGQRLPLDEAALEKLASIPNVKEVYPNLRIPVEISFGEFSDFTTAAGIPMSARGIGVFQRIIHGSFFPSETENLCMISMEFASRLTTGDAGELVGKDIILGYASYGGESTQGSLNLPGGLNVRRSEEKYRIVGIIEREPGSNFGGGLFSSIMIPLANARTRGIAIDLTNPQALLRQLSDKPSFASVTVRVDRPQHVEEVQQKIRDLGFSVFSVNDAFQGMKRAFIILDIILGLIGSIALSVASLGIVNTMVMSILERTREIGIMKAIGGSEGHIRSIFLVEAGSIGLMGGVVGVVLGWVVGRAINFGANIYIESQGGAAANLFTITWWLIGGGIAFAILVSLLAGSYPASRAANLDPIEALRHN